MHALNGSSSGHSVQTFSIILLHGSVFLTRHLRCPFQMAVFGISQSLPAAPPAAPGGPPAAPGAAPGVA